MTAIRRGAKRGLVIFLAVMAGLTLFSRTIRYATLPKVEVARVSGGALQTVISGSELLLDADDIRRVSVPVDLSNAKLRVERVLQQRLGAVRAGEALVSFEAALGENALAKAEQALSRAREALAGWDEKYQSSWKKISTDIAQLHKKMTEPSADLDALLKQVDALAEQQRALEDARVLDGVSRDERNQAVQDAEAMCEALRSLKEQDWALVASVDGVVSEELVKPGDEYTGLLPLMKLIPSSAAPRVGVATESKVEIVSDTELAIYAGDKPASSGEQEWVFAGESVEAGKRVLWATPSAALPDLSKLQKLSFRINSDYQQCIIPNSALVGGNQVFVLDERVGSFGQEELYARRVEVRGVQSDDKNSSISSGLNGMDRVIVKWDRPFNNGDSVALPLD